ncbi:MAG: GntR family transcriptional regulator [bacterium]|nr:GntR family transcriptional regulator [bacterium]
MNTFLTKTKQVEAYIKEGILNGKWSDKGKLPGEATMLAELGISRSTYREALAGLSSEGLISRKSGSGIYINGAVRRTGIAILARDTMISTPFGYWYRELADRWKVYTESEGYQTTLAFGYGCSDKAIQDSIVLFNSDAIKNTAGILSFLYPEPFVDILKRYRIPAVYIGAASEPLVSEAAVTINGDMLIDRVIETMSAAGYDDFSYMYLLDEEDLPHTGQVRYAYLKGEQHRHKIAGTDTDRLVPVTYSPDYSYAYDVFKEWWQGPNRSRAMFFADDALFDVASRAIVELGIRVPQDLAVLTYANVGRQFHFPVEVASIGLNPEEVAGKAWAMLSKLIKGEELSCIEEMIEPIVNIGASL